MSQYPSPYGSPPPYGSPSPYGSPGYPMPPGMPLGNRRSAARSAKILMIVLGSLGIIIGGMMTAMARIPLDQFPDAQRQQLDKRASDMGISTEAFMAMALAEGLRLLIPGVLLVVCGIFIRRGRRGAILTAMALTSLLLVWLILDLVRGLLNPAVGADMCGVFIVGAPLTILLYWLSCALRESAVPDNDAHYMAQYMQAMQQWYSQNSGGGYPTQPPAVPPPPAPPPPPALPTPPSPHDLPPPPDSYSPDR